MGIRERIKILFNHPFGFVLIWITAFGIIHLCGRVSSTFLDSISNHEHIAWLLKISALITVIIAIGIIVGGYRISHSGKYSKKSLMLTSVIALISYILTAYFIRINPSSAVLIMLNGLTLVIFSFSIGELLSREVMSPGHLLPVALVLALVDFWSVSGGPSREIAREITEFAGKEGYARNLTPPWTSFLLLRFPQLFMKEIYSFVGIGDLVIIAFFIGCVHRFNLPKMASYLALIFGTALAVLLANLLEKPLPVLPIIAILFIIINVRHLSMKRSDIYISAVVLGLIIVVIAVISMIRPS